jgi:hypothetical protein
MRRIRQKGGIIEKRRIKQMGDRRHERDGRERTLEEADNEGGSEESQNNEMRTRI